MAGPVVRMFLHLSLFVDIFSRKIISWEVHEREMAELASTLIQKAVWAEACISRPMVLHADSGSPTMGDTLRDAENDHSPGAATCSEVSLLRARMARKRDLPSVRPMPICD